MYWIHYNTSDGWTIELMRRAGWLAAHNNNVSSCTLARQLHQPQPQHSVTGAGDGGKTSSQHLMLLLVSEKCHYRVMMTSSDAQPGPDVGHQPGPRQTTGPGRGQSTGAWEQTWRTLATTLAPILLERDHFMHIELHFIAVPCQEETVRVWAWEALICSAESPVAHNVTI